MIAVKSLLYRILIIFSIGFVITLPFPFFKIPDLGGFLAKVFIGVNQFWGKLFHVSSDSEFRILSDSTGLYLHLLTLLTLSCLFGLAWCVKSKTIHPAIKKYFRIGVAYYLSLILFKYGFDKVFKHQFYFPEPNLLYTPLHQLSKDVLFWSSMGTSRVYSIFSGMIELLPAILLLFRKTRLLGGVIAFCVLVNVVMINFGFDISVKVFSIFLLLLSTILISSDIKRLFQLFANIPVENKPVERVFTSKRRVFKYALLKSLVIGLVLFESIGPYIEIQNFNDDKFPKPYLNGAYSVTKSNELDIKRVFFHRKQFFIIQYTNDDFESFEVVFSNDKKSITLISEYDSTIYYQLSVDFDGLKIDLEGKLKGSRISIQAIKEDLQSKEISSDTFKWRFN